MADGRGCKKVVEDGRMYEGSGGWEGVRAGVVRM